MKRIGIILICILALVFLKPNVKVSSASDLNKVLCSNNVSGLIEYFEHEEIQVFKYNDYFEYCYNHQSLKIKGELLDIVFKNNVSYALVKDEIEEITFLL